MQATFRDMIDNGVGMTSTGLVVYEISVEGRPPAPSMKRVYEMLAPEIAAEVRAIAEQRRAGIGAIPQDVYRAATEYERALREGRGLLAAGGGSHRVRAPAPPGLGDQRNYEPPPGGGFTGPRGGGQIMTLNGAKILGIDGQVGSVGPGKTADLVVVQGDVEADGHLRNTRIVFPPRDRVGLGEAVRLHPGNRGDPVGGILRHAHRSVLVGNRTRWHPAITTMRGVRVWRNLDGVPWAARNVRSRR